MLVSRNLERERKDKFSESRWWMPSKLITPRMSQPSVPLHEPLNASLLSASVHRDIILYCKARSANPIGEIFQSIICFSYNYCKKREFSCSLKIWYFMIYYAFIFCRECCIIVGRGKLYENQKQCELALHRITAYSMKI